MDQVHNQNRISNLLASSVKNWLQPLSSSVFQPSLLGSNNDRVSGSTAASNVSPWRVDMLQRKTETFSFFEMTNYQPLEVKKHSIISRLRSYICIFCSIFWPSWLCNSDEILTGLYKMCLHEDVNQALLAKSLQGLSPILQPHPKGRNYRQNRPTQHKCKKVWGSLPTSLVDK